MTTRFEAVKACPDATLPVRATEHSAGYDMFCAQETVVPAHCIGLIPTGVKCYLKEDQWLMIAVRSSTPKKKGLILANGVGIIDADYVDNPTNEGQIYIQVYNLLNTPATIKKGERIAQGLVMSLNTLDEDNTTGVNRTGGFGSTK